MLSTRKSLTNAFNWEELNVRTTDVQGNNDVLSSKQSCHADKYHGVHSMTNEHWGAANVHAGGAA